MHKFLQLDTGKRNIGSQTSGQQGQCGERRNRERGIGKTFEDRDKYCAQRVCRLVIPFMGAYNEMQEKGEAEKVGAEENLRSCAAFLGGIMIG